ncbi:hypothetical protein, partial [Nonomuraea diastatica]
RYNATASALNSGGYDFIATWNSLPPDFHHPALKVSTHRGEGPTAVTETVYRHQIRPVIQTGALAMDRIFDDLTDV